MKKIPFKLIALVCSLSMSMYAQQFETPLQEYKVNNDIAISVEASYAEIEIVEWNKNKVEIQGIMTVQGLPEDEAQSLFDSWDINTQADANTIRIRSNSSNFGNEYFFFNSDKYLGNVIVDVPALTGRVVDIIDSIHFVMPELENFPDMNFEMNPNFQFNGDSIAFDYEEFKNNSEYLEQWQERNKEQLELLKEELKENQAELAMNQKEIQREIKEAQREVQREMKKANKEMQEEMHEAQKEVHEAQKEMQREMHEAQFQARAEIHRETSEREHEVMRIMEDRQKVKVKKRLIIKVPKNAKLELDVDYCKITTVK
jgi:hypothetical protein